jgi:hypothetical protein
MFLMEPYLVDEKGIRFFIVTLFGRNLKILGQDP